jgi:hypothetical protein
MRKPKRTCDKGRAIHPDIAEEIQAEYRTGQFSQNQLAQRHVISNGLANKLCKGVEKDLQETLNAGIAYKSTLYEKSKIEVNVLEKLSDERAKDTAFFNNAQRKLADIGLALINKSIDKKTGIPLDNFSIQELQGVSNVVQTSRTGILGKPGDTTNIQINNTVRIEDLLGDL